MFISKEASAILDKIIACANNETHVKIDKAEGTYMPVIFERLADVEIQNLGICKHYSIAHYYEQNGDLMADPEMCILEVCSGHRIAYYFRQDGTGTEITAIGFKNGRQIMPLINDSNEFFNVWMQNIEFQQGL